MTTRARLIYDWLDGEDREAALAELRDLMSDLLALEEKIEAAGAPWTPGRIPTWEPED